MSLAKARLLPKRYLCDVCLKRRPVGDSDVSSICRSVKPGGRVVLVEYRGEDPAVPIKPLHKMTEQQVKTELSALPLDWVQSIEVLPRQHIFVWRKRSP